MANSYTFSFYTKDASGSPAPNTAIVIASANTALATVSPTSGTTDSTGKIDVTVTAANSLSNGGVVAITGTYTEPGTGRTVVGTHTSTILPKVQTPTTVVLTPSSASLDVGATQQLAATVNDQDGNVISGASVTWTSNNTSVATVDTSGHVTIVGPGSATITATSGGASATCAITGVAVLGSVAVSPSSATINGSGTQQITATPKDMQGGNFVGATVTYASSNTAVATVSSSGLVTSTGVGTATITVTAAGHGGPVTNTVAITVAQVVGSVTVSPSTISIGVGGTQQLSATVKDSFGTTMPAESVTWSTSSASIASVDQSGLVTGVAGGSATITATSNTNNAIAGTCALSVTTAGVTVDLNALSDLGGQFPIFADGTFTYPGRSLTRGQTYPDPRSQILVTKVSDPNWPAANTGYYPDYAGIWCGLSNAWGGGKCTIIGRLENGGGFWLIDFDPSQSVATSRISNGRLAVKQPALDTCSHFSPVPGEEQIVYIFSSDRHLYRVDTATNTVAAKGAHPAGGKDFTSLIDSSHAGDDMQVSADGRFMLVFSTAGDFTLLWDTQTDKIYKLPCSEDQTHAAYLSPDGKWVGIPWSGTGIHLGNTLSIYDVTKILADFGGGTSPITVPSSAPYKFDVDTDVDCAHTCFAGSALTSVLPTRRNSTSLTGYYNPATNSFVDNGIAWTDPRQTNYDHLATQWQQPDATMQKVMALASNYAGDRITPTVAGWSVQQGTGAATIYKCAVDYTGSGNNQSAGATSTIAQTKFKVLHKDANGYYVGNAKTFATLAALVTAIGNGTTDVTAYDTANGTVIASHGACAFDSASGTWYQWQPGGANPTGFADAFAPMGLEMGIALVSVDGTIAKFIANAYTFFKAGGSYGENYWAATHANQSHDGRFVWWASSQGTQDTQGGTYRVDGYIVALPTTAGTGTYTPVATTIAITPAGPLTVSAGATQQLVATVYDQRGAVMSGQTIVWSSSASGVATVSSSGLVTAVASGTATITATSGGLSNTVTVAVPASGGGGGGAFVVVGTEQTSSSQANIAAASAIGSKIHISGDRLHNFPSGGLALLGGVGNSDGSSVKFYVLCDDPVGDGNIRFTIDGMPNGGMRTPTVAKSTFDATKFYTIYVGLDPAGATTKQEITVLEDTTNTVMATATSTSSPGTLPTTSTGFVFLGNMVGTLFGSAFPWGGAIDGAAVYSAMLSGSARNAAPTTGDANILWYVPFSEGSGTTAANAVVSATALTLTSPTWTAGGSWN